MTSTKRLVLLFWLAAATLLGARTAHAQADLAKAEQDLIRKTVSTLNSFANTAKSAKVGQRAKQAYDLILAYDPDNAAARRELGWRKERGEWTQLPPEKRTKWKDKANYEGRFKVTDEWYKTAVKLGQLHRDLGLKYKAAGDEQKANYHLEKAVYYNANDREANIALGYKEGPGFFGTEAQITYAARMKQIELKAVELARKKDYAVTELPQDQMPIELQNLQANVPDFMRKPDINIFGAKSEHFTVWTRGIQENANDAVIWGERALEFGVYLLGENNAKKLQFVERASRTFAWYGFLFTGREREELLKANPNIWAGQPNVEAAMRFANTEWRAKEGAASVHIGGSPKSIHDTMIAYVFFMGLTQGRNDGIGQGLIHAMTWYLKATSISRWGALPEGTQGDDALQLPQGTNWWLRTVRDQATSNQDWPLAQVPREKLSRFRNDCRLKSWSFMTWVVAAYPDKWLELYLALPDADKKVPTLEDIEAIVVKVIGKSTEAIDAEWREWARGDSGVAFGTGYGPPLLPERPNKEELAAIERINFIRGQQIAFTWADGGKMTEGTLSGLPECELDAEASFGCDAHAHYVSNHPDLMEKPGPEIHEEDPAHEDFTRRGQLAGGGNIVTGKGSRGADFAKDTVDLWMGTPYHRFPMLEHNIKRLGYSFVYENDWSVAVLDMHSLEEPYDPGTAPRFLVWPPPGSDGIPTSFPAPESPNPLADQPEDQQDVTKCGYPISLQLQRELAIQIVDSSIELFESRKGGRPPTQHFVHPKGDGAVWKAWTERCKPEPVPIWVHTPKVPLNKKMDLRDVVFCLPKEALDKGKAYQVRVHLQIGTADPLVFVWEFTTGSSSRDLRIK
ncbi:MAG: hypothetical protein H6838_11400 [Planctomycetes bacterium]|nr:hypothetical protein [Planctomycetota bacterium]MCB9886090.1 hypothetical protein [Planctomycetota bacterium]